MYREDREGTVLTQSKRDLPQEPFAGKNNGRTTENRVLNRISEKVVRISTTEIIPKIFNATID